LDDKGTNAPTDIVSTATLEISNDEVAVNKYEVQTTNNTQRFNGKIRQVTKRKRGISLKEMLRELRPKLQGWLNHDVMQK
jgi:cell pole-organizing protein PopZ